MVELKEALLKTLEKLKEEEFGKFKWYLENGVLEGLSGIPVAQLEKAIRETTVDLMVQKYQGPGATKATMKIFEKIGRNDLVQDLQNFNNDVSQRENIKRKNPKLTWVKQFAVDVTLDPDTAHSHLILSGDGKQVHHCDVRKKLPMNSKRFTRTLDVLGKQGFSSGKSYFEVQVKGKTTWTVGVVKESINRGKNIPLCPENGFWTLWLRNEDEYEANAGPAVDLSLSHHPQKVGVFVDYEEGEVSFYDVDAADLLYSFTGCSFTEKIYPYVSPETNDGGINSAPLIISPVSPGGQKEEYERKKAELMSVQQFAVKVTLDPDTAHPNLILSRNGKQVHHGDVRKPLPENPQRFDRCVNVLGEQGFSSGKSYFEVQVKHKTAWTVGVAKESIERKGDITLHPCYGFWTIGLENDDEYKAFDNPLVQLSLNHPPQKLGVFVDYEKGLVSFYDVDTADLLYSFTGCTFTEKIYPFFSPCTNGSGINSAPLIISPVNRPLNLKKHEFGDQKEYERKKAELMRVQQFAVKVTLDPDTAHPALILRDDGKQVSCGDVYKILPDNAKRFRNCLNILGKQSFSSGKSYFEVQVKGKTAWTVGVAKESINRGKNITLGPENGYWTLGLRNADEYVATDDPAVDLSLSHHPQKVGVFVDYEKGLVSFCDVDTADLLYSFTGCSFTEKIYPFFSPEPNKSGRNSAPLIISPVNRPLDLKKHEFGDQKEYERKKAELMRVQQFAEEVTLDPDTAHPALILWDDRKQVSGGDVNKILPDNAKRFRNCLNILGEKGFSSGRLYFEVQVKGKTAWTVGMAKESINRGKHITLCPENGFWTLGLRNEDEYMAIDDPAVDLSLKLYPQKVGVFVDYEEGEVSFYDVDAADLLYSFTSCSFTEKIYPFFSPETNDGGINSAPLIISPVSPGGQKEEYERKKAELMSVQQFAVKVTLDPDTAHPNLILSHNGKQVHHGDVRKPLPENPQRFDRCVNVLGEQGFSSGKSYFEVQVKHKTAWTVGVAKESIERKGDITLHPCYGFWTIGLENDDEYKAFDNPLVQLSLNHPPQKLGVFVDYEKGLVSFYDVDTADLVYSFTGCTFTEKIYPFFGPCTNGGGINSAPLIISPVNRPLNLKKHEFGDQKEYERKKAELMRVQQFAVKVTLDPDTAHPALILRDDGKQVSCGNVYKELPDNAKRFMNCLNILGKQSFSSGRLYFEVQVKGKTSWTVGVAKESINRKNKITLGPENGFWTLWLRNEDEYMANDDPAVHLSLSHHPQKVGVFVNYEEGLVSFYDVDTADLLYSFTGCSFTEKIYPFFSPEPNKSGRNSAPLIISPVNRPLDLKKHEFGDQKEYERKKAELMRVQQFAVEVTLDPDTAHPALILWDDRKQVSCGDVYKILPDNAKRFRNCPNILGEQGFSSGKSYFEVQVKGKTAWTVGMAKESINRGKRIPLCPENGYWTLWLRNEDEYVAIDDPAVHLSLSHYPQKVGVFVDYEEGLVSFYDVDTADLLYSFTGCSFTEKLLPYFSPCTNDNGRNSAPLIICPVNQND
ncbi:uncharacterized protein [Cebidichthys violaceus]|uniref:uncharacterized protein n=1 Tax=Cebidichthys violaceus TaxID=271503 RepID=UPI0035CC9E71